MKIEVKHFFDPDTNTLTYVVWDSKTQDAVIIDPVLDYDQASSTTSENSIQPVIQFIQDAGLKPLFILESHAHADHLSGSQVLKKIFPKIQLAIGDKIRVVQRTFGEIFNLGPQFKADGSQFDRLLEDGERFKAGSIDIEVIHTPGHTPACCVYRIGEHLFVGDLIFMPDSGTGRCDFPDGDAKSLFQSVQKLYKLSDAYFIYTGHDYQPEGRALKYKCSIGQQKEANVHIRASTIETEFIKMRTDRDKTLKAPRLLLPSVQINIDGGRLPEPEANGKRYLRIPIS